MEEYYKRVREVAVALLRGISKNLGVEENYIDKAMKLDSSVDMAISNVYPAMHQTNIPVGQSDHYDPGLLILLLQNGKWIHANIPPNSIFVNIADHLEILTNGKYKSAIHRVVVNNKVRRMSIAQNIGPPLDLLVSPAPEFVDESHPPAYRGLTYKDYLEYHHYDPIEAKSCLTQIRL